MLAVIDEAAAAVRDARQDMRRPGRRTSIAEITYRFRRRVDEASRGLVDADVAGLVADLERPYGRHAAHVRAGARRHRAEPAHPQATCHRCTRSRRCARSWTRWTSSRSDEAQPILQMATLSVTEAMATAMHLHSMGWKSTYHHENLAHGLAPADLGTMLQQRLRWAQGTLQVMLKENPLVQKGLSVGQRLMYFAAMWSCLSGFFALAYIAAPIFFLCFDVRPVISYGPDFLIRLVPYLVVNQLLFLAIGYGKRTWRGTQFSLALFPLWIRATWTAVANVVFHRPLGFVVLPKTKQEQAGPPWRLIWPQLTAMVLLVAAGGVGTARYLMGTVSFDLLSLVVNLVWAAFDLVILSVVISAARCTAGPPPSSGRRGD